MGSSTQTLSEMAVPAGKGNPVKFRAEWVELRKFLDRLDSDGAHGLQPQSVLSLEKLYLSCLSDLGTMRENGMQPSQERMLNDLLARAYGWIYQAPERTWKDVVLFLLFRFPEAFQQRIHFIIVAAAIFIASMGIGFLGVGTESKLVDLVMAPHHREALQKDIRWFQNQPRNVPNEGTGRMLATNIFIAIKAFAFGLLFGAGTIYVLIAHGLLLGGMAAVYHQAGLGLPFWAVASPHGALEFAGIVVAGGAGLILGYALLVPGLESRATALGRESQAAAGLLLGTVPFFLFAALVELYVSSNAHIPDWGKFLVALGTVVGLGLYVALPHFKDGLSASLLGTRSAQPESVPPVPAPEQ